jgi:uncharacterized membrane protein
LHIERQKNLSLGGKLMSVLLDNMPMIGLNSFLALLPILFGWFMVKTRQLWLRVVFAVAWFSFLPNTLYTLTDLRYLPGQWMSLHHFGKVALALQYLIYELFGVSSFLLALYQGEKLPALSRRQQNNVVLPLLLILANAFIGFGMVLGRVQRLNSWDLFLNLPKVLYASFSIVSSFRLMLYVVLLAIVANLVYFFFRKLLLRGDSYLHSKFSRG